MRPRRPPRSRGGTIAQRRRQQVGAVDRQGVALAGSGWATSASMTSQAGPVVGAVEDDRRQVQIHPGQQRRERSGAPPGSTRISSAAPSPSAASTAAGVGRRTVGETPRRPSSRNTRRAAVSAAHKGHRPGNGSSGARRTRCRAGWRTISGLGTSSAAPESAELC